MFMFITRITAQNAGQIQVVIHRRTHTEIETNSVIITTVKDFTNSSVYQVI